MRIENTLYLDEATNCTNVYCVVLLRFLFKLEFACHGFTTPCATIIITITTTIPMLLNQNTYSARVSRL